LFLSAGSSDRGTIAEVNVVPLIDVLLVLLVIFMIIPHRQFGLRAEIPQSSLEPSPERLAGVVVVQVSSEGALRINEEAVTWEKLQRRLEEVYRHRAERVVFIRGEASVEFSQVARAIDVIKSAGLGPVGLMTPGLQQGPEE